MKTLTERIFFDTTTQTAFVDITGDIYEIVHASGVRNGVVVVFVPHTTMGVIINHYEPMLLQDFVRTLYRAAPVHDHYAHDVFELRRQTTSDGRSNGHAHCKALFLPTSQSIPLVDGHPVMSPTQAVIVVDSDGPRKRDVIVQIVGI